MGTLGHRRDPFDEADTRPTDVGGNSSVGDDEATIMEGDLYAGHDEVSWGSLPNQPGLALPTDDVDDEITECWNRQSREYQDFMAQIAEGDPDLGENLVEETPLERLLHNEAFQIVAACCAVVMIVAIYAVGFALAIGLVGGWL